MSQGSEITAVPAFHGPGGTAGSTPETTSMGVLRAVSLCIHFGGVKAVDQVSFQVEAGCLFGVLGPNGSGKSTLLAAITRLQRPTSGRIYLHGEDITKLPPNKLARRGVGRTFQTPRLVPTMDVKANVALAADRRSRPLWDRPTKSGKGRVDDVHAAMTRAGIADAADLFPEEISYGNRRRVEIARALAHDPSLLLLDEPTAGMNRQERDEISELLDSLRKQGLTQVLVEHDVPMMVELCDVILAMVQGQVVAVGNPKEVIANETVRKAYLGRKRK
ncbi:ABC transporter ATP-binding protein [Dactylosporangium sp. NPDC005572]|uniref:ABC transporter ATP-binding protein n=1 Tax=Dactylosporangium sp. NPDC005572 TaxID=3156889 RepID=UPI0033A1EE23